MEGAHVLLKKVHMVGKVNLVFLGGLILHNQVLVLKICGPCPSSEAFQVSVFNLQPFFYPSCQRELSYTWLAIIPLLKSVNGSPMPTG